MRQPPTEAVLRDRPVDASLTVGLDESEQQSTRDAGPKRRCSCNRHACLNCRRANGSSRRDAGFPLRAIGCRVASAFVREGRGRAGAPARDFGQRGPRRQHDLAFYMGCCAHRRHGHVTCGTHDGRPLLRSTQSRPKRGLAPMASRSCLRPRGRSLSGAPAGRSQRGRVRR